MKKSMLAVGTVLACATGLVLGHGGGLDANGGHNDRKSGGYHFHQGPLAGRSFASKSDAMKALAEAQRGKDARPPEKKDDGDQAPAKKDGPEESPAVQVQALKILLVRKGLITEEEFSRAVRELR